MVTGTCLCGDVTFRTDALPQEPTACHCGQCRKQSGHVWASAYVGMSDLSISGTVKWYAASESAERGFCPRCGSLLFWRAPDEDTISFSLGALASPTGITLERHIFVADKGDYYEIADGLPQQVQD